MHPLTPTRANLARREAALVALGQVLRALDYHFVTVTPETHRRVLARDPRLGSSLRDVLGWSRTFPKTALPADVFALLEEADALDETPSGWKSRVRVSSLAGELFVHAAYPTADPSAVFFGPDTYRFCAAIRRAGIRARRVVDVGCGSGAGGIVAGRAAERIVLADVNDAALAFARVNAALAGQTKIETVRSDVLADVDGIFDLVLANPPYMRDEARRTYRDGGGAFGEGLSLRILRESIARLAPGGTLLLYTGAPIVDGRDVFIDAAAPVLNDAQVAFDYEEIDPDVFGEELDNPGYAAVERIAAVVLTARRSHE